MPATARNELVGLTVSDSPWLEVGRWESSEARGSWPDYPTVVRNLGEEVFRHFGAANIVIFYVCGKELFEKGMPTGHRIKTEHYPVGVVATGRPGLMPRDPGREVRQKHMIYLATTSHEY